MSPLGHYSLGEKLLCLSLRSRLDFGSRCLYLIIYPLTDIYSISCAFVSWTHNVMLLRLRINSRERLQSFHSTEPELLVAAMGQVAFPAVGPF